MNLVLWGATGQAVVLAELFRHRDDSRIVALFDNAPPERSPIDGVPVYRGETFEQWAAATSESCYGLVAVGGDRGEDRIEIAHRFATAGITLATAIHPRAFVATDATIGAGSQILAMSAVAARAIVGENCIVNTSASVDHECRLEDGVHIAPGATLAGCVVVGRAAFVGTNATILPRVRIGARAVIGAGSVVTEDVPDGVVVAGNPARLLRRRS